ncbi:MAG: PDZ domain-containing protein, partial [Paracoccaceae bacterium]|nr:PDZ domain-containing protein [Paracoccaceae bacterium]
LVRTVGNTQVGAAVRVVVLRDGATETILVTLGRRETAEAAVPAVAPAPEPEEPTEIEVLGMTLVEISDEMRAEIDGISDLKGLLVANVDEETEAFKKGLRQGDVITEAGQQKIESIGDLQDRLAEAEEAGRKSILLLVRRDGDPRFVAISLS